MWNKGVNVMYLEQLKGITRGVRKMGYFLQSQEVEGCVKVICLKNGGVGCQRGNLVFLWRTQKVGV